MLNKNQTSKSRLMWLLLLIPLLGMTSVLFARTEKKADMIELEKIYPTDADLSAKLAQDGYLIGKVIDENGPVAEARVSVINLKGMVAYNSLTDQDGNFILREYNPEYMIRIIKTGYKEFKGIINSDNPVVSLAKLKDNGNAGNERDSQLMEALEMEADELPEFPGGTVSLLEYLRKNIKYPAVCRENNVQGRVVVSFTIDTDGSITDAEVVRSVDPLLDAEALRTISQMPAWKPGKKDGNIVKVKYSVPINFRLDSSTARSATPQWIYLYDATLGKESWDGVFSVLLSSPENDVQGTGILDMPEVKALKDAFKAAQIEGEAMQRSFTDEMSSIQFKIINYKGQRETSLSESQRTSLEQEIAEAEVMLQQKNQELNNKIKEWNDEMKKSLEPQMETVWQLISKNGAYICIDHFGVNPPNDAVVAPDNLASALNDLFEHRRNSVFLPFSDDNYQQVKTLLSEKYSNETVFFRHR